MDSLLDGAKERVGAVTIDELKAMASELMPEMLGIFKGQVGLRRKADNILTWHTPGPQLPSRRVSQEGQGEGGSEIQGDSSRWYRVGTDDV